MDGSEDDKRPEAEWGACWRSWEQARYSPQGAIREDQDFACEHALAMVGRSTFEWCKKNNKSIYETNVLLETISDFLNDLYAALTRDDLDAPRLKTKVEIWRHKDITEFMLNADTDERTTPLHYALLKDVADKYVDSPWLQNRYLGRVDGFNEHQAARETDDG